MLFSVENVLFPTKDFPFKSEFFVTLALDHKSKDITIPGEDDGFIISVSTIRHLPGLVP